MKAALDDAGLASANVVDAFFNSGGNLKTLASEKRTDVERQKDGKIGSVDCYVIAENGKSFTITVWIGKQDFLLHQCQTEQAIIGPPTTVTETRENIVINQSFAKSDFIHPVAGVLKVK